MMPEMDGFAFLEAIKEKVPSRHIPVVVLTAKDLSAEEKQLLSGRTAQVLAKADTSSGDLAEAIRKTGDAYNRSRFTAFVQSLFRTWLRWSR